VFIASNTSNTWTITSATTGTVKSTSFSCFEDLRGGTAADTFRALQGTTFAGTFNGCGGVDELDYAAFTSTVEVSLLTGAATGLSGVSGIENITGGDGNDFLVGDSANNVISGRDGDDIIFGWSGSDSLSGNGGRDFVIGGTGGDTVHGNNAEDILVAGTLVYANETTSALDRTAVDALMAEWRRTDLAYAARISHLNGTTGGGLNGIYRLNAITVVDDNEMDILHGDAGLDWFLAGAKDSVIASGNETETFT
jgi:Ca2+-binding RTX toxin-like protein